MAENNNNLLETKKFVCNLFNMPINLVDSIHCTNENNQAIIHLKLVNSSEPCPICGCTSPKIHSYHERTIAHSVINSQECLLKYNQRRFQCPNCSKTYNEKNPFVKNRSKISPLTEMNVLKDLKNYHETFTSVAARYHISPTTVQSIFDSHVVIPRTPLPRYITIDEVYAFKSDKSKYVCVLVDFITHDIIDVLPSRKLHVLLDYFHAIPLEEREKVLLLSMDMWDSYRTVGKTMFPNCKNCLDYFHLIQELNRRIDSIRIRAMKGTKNGTTGYYLLKKFSWLLYTTDEKKLDCNREKVFNHKFNKYLNYYDLKQMILDEHQELDEAINLRDALVKIHDEATLDNVAPQITDLIEEFGKASTDEMRSFASTLINWKQEFINSFSSLKSPNGEIIYLNSKKNDSQHKPKIQRISNGIAENRNKIIKVLKANANGYRNWNRFRNRVIYCLNKEKYYLLNPDKEVLLIQQQKRKSNYERFKNNETPHKNYQTRKHSTGNGL